MKYIIDTTDDQNSILLRMMTDRSYWAVGIPPATINELLKWAIDDYIDSYRSYLLTRKGNEIYGKCNQNY